MHDLGPHEDGDSENAHEQADGSAAGDAVAAEDERLEHEKPDRRHGNDERGKTRRNILLGPSESAVAADEQQNPMAASRRASRPVMRMFRPNNVQAASMIGPAIRNRMAHMTSGGMPAAEVMPMARYVDPQKTYTKAKAMMTLRRWLPDADQVCGMRASAL